MHRMLRPTLAAVVVTAMLACTSDGQAATEAPRVAKATPAGATPLFREAAQAAPAQPEAQVPLQASLAPLIERLKPAVVNISTTTW